MRLRSLPRARYKLAQPPCRVVRSWHACNRSLRTGSACSVSRNPPRRSRSGPRASEPRTGRVGGNGEAQVEPPATGRAKSVPDVAVTNRAQREVTGTLTVTPRRRLRSVIAGQTPFLLGGGSRIRTLEGFSRRIYSPLHTRSDGRCAGSGSGPVCGPSQQTQQRSATRYDADQRQVISAGERHSRGCDQASCLVAQKILSI
jgi:hypothetical protein